mmetsp:Transcript_20704/g.25623  ORF Transcript_20704/g.25623 Transcript_20704/m.25623 type:complete len:262 (+) Transcript_20704:169-954(+)
MIRNILTSKLTQFNPASLLGRTQPPHRRHITTPQILMLMMMSHRKRRRPLAPLLLKNIVLALIPRRRRTRRARTRTIRPIRPTTPVERRRLIVRLAITVVMTTVTLHGIVVQFGYSRRNARSTTFAAFRGGATADAAAVAVTVRVVVSATVVVLAVSSASVAERRSARRSRGCFGGFGGVARDGVRALFFARLVRDFFGGAAGGGRCGGARGVAFAAGAVGVAFVFCGVGFERDFRRGFGVVVVRVDVVTGSAAGHCTGVV